MIPAGAAAVKIQRLSHGAGRKADPVPSSGRHRPHQSLIKTPEQIRGIKESARINVAVLDYVAAHIGPGITTAQIDLWVYEQTTRLGGIPAPLGYNGFPEASAPLSMTRYATAFHPKMTF